MASHEKYACRGLRDDDDFPTSRYGIGLGLHVESSLERARLIERRRGAIVLTDPARLGRLIEEAQGLE
jgi:hypothetical protein